MINTFGMIGGLAGFVWLFVHDWKLALAVFFIMWGNNMSIKNAKNRG